jgi:signal peptidase II
MSNCPCHSPAAISRFVGAAIIGLFVDLWTKSLAVAHLKEQDDIEFIKGYLHFGYTENHGAVFGIGQGHRWLFIMVSILAVVFLTFLFLRSGRQRMYQIILGMLLAGVWGNLYDRFQFGYVRDMIHALPRWPHLFPYIFNVADSLLCTGVALMLLHGFLYPQRPTEPEPLPTPEAQS